MVDEFPQIQILYQDQDLVIINKPSGVVVNRADSVKEKTIQDWFVQFLAEAEQQDKVEKEDWQKMIPDDFLAQYGSPEEIWLRRKGLVHRIDKETSGILLLARHPGSLVNLLVQFEKRQTHKKYWCLVHGQLQVDSAQVNAPISRSSTNRHQFRVEIDGRRAMTNYRVLKVFQDFNEAELTAVLEEKKVRQIKEQQDSYAQGFSLLECELITGRTHQIRVHMKHLGHPLVADVVYGGRRRARIDRLWCSRQFLHARWLSFIHPRTGKRVEATAPLAEELKQAIEFIQ